MAIVTNGHIIQEGDTFDPNGPELFYCYKLVQDGSRRLEVVILDPSEPTSSLEFYRLNGTDSPVRPELYGTLATDSDVTPRFGITMILTNAYAGYAFTPTFIDRSEVPVNQIPYALTWKEHLAKIAYQIVQPVGEMFEHLENAGEFSPVSVHMTTTHQRKHEALNRNMRRLIGGLWGKVAAYENSPVTGTTVWPAQTPVMHALVNKLCELCTRGWKTNLLKKMDEEAWISRFSSHPDEVFFPNRSGNAWGVGDALSLTQHELDNALSNFNRAWSYYESTDGDEPDVHADAVLAGIAELRSQ